MEHTPTPWKVGASSKVKIFRADDLTRVCECDHSQIAFEESESNADHIVRCVNSHDVLVEALEECLNQLKTLKAEAKERWTNERVNMVSAATVNGCYALKQAKGE